MVWSVLGRNLLMFSLVYFTHTSLSLSFSFDQHHTKKPQQKQTIGEFWAVI